MAESIGGSLVPKIDLKVRKTSQNQPKLKFSEKVKNHVFHADVANFGSSEDSDTHFMVETTIFRGTG